MQNSLISTNTITCPHLGLRDDPSSFLGDPSPGNVCYHCKFPTSPLTSHQETYCLADAHLQCLVYAQDEKKPFPRNLKGVDLPPDFQRSHTLRNFGILFGVGLLLLLGWYVFQYFTTGKITIPGFPQATQTFLVTPVATTVQPGLVLLTALPVQSTKIPDPKATLAPTPTAKPSQVHALEAPVKVDNQEYLIHLAMDGEGFDYLAKTYKTAVEVIRAINYLLPPAIWVNLPIVITPGVTSIDPALPAFEAYKVVKQDISIDDLAKKLKVEVTLLRHYNACPDGCSLAVGDWVIVPHSR